jgi:PhnB protein
LTISSWPPDPKPFEILNQTARKSKEATMLEDMPKSRANRPSKRIMQGVIPYLSLAGRVGEAAEFYVRNFGAIDVGKSPMKATPDQFAHLQLEINGGALMLSDHADDTPRSGPPMEHGHLQLVLADGREWFDRAVNAGCEIVTPFARQPWGDGHQNWGDNWGMVRDPFGILWVVLTPDPVLWEEAE